MSEILNKLAQCERVTEWLNPHSSRLEAATGVAAPNGGASVREPWPVEEDDFSLLAQTVKRIIVPRLIGSRVLAFVSGDADFNRVILKFEDPRDWSTCFPAEEGTNIFTGKEGQTAWAAVGLCETELGLAVFAQEKAGIIEARIQPVLDEIFANLINGDE